MKIIHIYKDFNPLGGGGGVARYIYNLSSQFKEYDISVISQNYLHTFSKKTFDSINSSLKKNFDLIKKSDIVNIHGSRIIFSFFYAFIAILYKKKIIYTPHCYYNNGNFFNKFLKKIWDFTFERFLIKNSQKVILLSNYWLSYFKERNFQTNNSLVIPVLIPERNFPLIRKQNKAIKKNSFIKIIYLGRLDPVKRIFDLFLLLKRFPGKYELHIVGKGSEEVFLRKYVSKNNLTNIYFYNFLSDIDVRKLLENIDIFVLPSEEEGQPAIILEMLFSGIPVVASKIFANQSILSKFYPNNLFKLYDINDLNLKIQAAILNKPDTKKINSIKNIYSLERNLFKFKELYNNINKCHNS